jgi:adenylosuccinate synthase
VGPSKSNKVGGVCKAYTSRVGDGPFPTELFDETGNTIREVGKEYGTTTGRPRRVGWFDSVVMRHSKRVSGITNLSLNSIDVLTGLPEVKICVAYDLDGERIDYYPASLEKLQRCTPIYETLPGWTEDITSCKTLSELPENARNYIRRVSELVGVRISTFSVGPGREQTNVLESVWAQA